MSKAPITDITVYSETLLALPTNQLTKCHVHLACKYLYPLYPGEVPAVNLIVIMCI